MISDRKKTYQMLCLSLPSFLSSRLPSSSSLHLCLLWFEGGVWGQSALVLLNGWQMTEKLEAFRSWQVVVCARFSPFFLLQMFFVSLFSVKLSRRHNKCNRCMHIRTHRHIRRITQMCRFCCVLIGSDFCVLRLVAMGGGRGAACSQRCLPLR